MTLRRVDRGSNRSHLRRLAEEERIDLTGGSGSKCLSASLGISPGSKSLSALYVGLATATSLRAGAGEGDLGWISSLGVRHGGGDGASPKHFSERRSTISMLETSDVNS